MPVQIGVTSHDFSRPTGLLSDCHRRIEMFLGSLAAVGRVVERPVTDETRRVLTTALRYFREAAPKHTADEEDSLFPRLRKANNADAKSALEELERLEHDHRFAESVHAEIERLGQLYLSKGHLSLEDAGAYRQAIASLKSMYEQHIDIEDRLIFPIAERVLSANDQRTIGGEMAARRGLSAAPEVPRTEIDRVGGSVSPTAKQL